MCDCLSNKKQKNEPETKLTPVKVHTFLKSTGVSPVAAYLPVIAHQKGVTAEGIGIIYSATPIFSIIVNVVSGSIADAFRIHRQVFYAGMTLMIGAMIAVYYTPDSLQTQVVMKGQFVCENPNSLLLSLQNRNCSYSCTFISKRIVCTSKNSSDYACSIDAISISWQSQNIIDNCFISRNNCMSVEIRSPIFQNISCTGKKTDNNCAAVCPAPSNKIPFFELATYYEYWLIFVSIVLFYAGNISSVNMSDTAALCILGSKHHRFGLVRLYGSLGWGIGGLLSGILVNLNSKNLPYKDFFPAFVCAFILNIINLFVSRKIDFSYTTVSAHEEKALKSAVFKVLRLPCAGMYLFASLVVGFSMGVVWSFLFILVDDTAASWDPNFSSAQILQGLLVAVDCFLGEIPWFFFSGFLLKLIGYMNAINLVLICVSLRFFFYAFVTNPWVFLPIELLHGACFGLFYASAGSFAGALAPEGTVATLQGVLRGTVMAGVSVGGFVGGIMYGNYGSRTAFLFLSAMTSVCALLFAIASCFVRGPEDGKHDMRKQEDKGKGKEETEEFL